MWSVYQEIFLDPHIQSVFHLMRFCVTQTVSILSGSAGIKQERDADVQWSA